MDASKIKSSVLSVVNDDIQVTEYGHGHLVTMPVGFYDDDLVTLFIEPYEGGVRISDQGTTAMRLHMANVDLDSPKIAESWRRSVAALGNRSAAADDGVIAAWGSSDDLGGLLIAVAEAAIRADQLRWAVQERQPVRFKDKVVDRLSRIAADKQVVRPNASIHQKSGRTRRVTAAVGADPATAVYVQAISASSGDYGFEHCYYIFSHTDVERKRRLAVASGAMAERTQLLQELEEVVDVALFDSGDDLERKLSSRIASLR